MPALVGNYHSFYSLEDINGVHGGVSKVFGVHTTVYKCIVVVFAFTSFSYARSSFPAFSLKDGLSYVLRKVDVSLRINVDFALKVFEKWKGIQCSSIVSIREVFRSSRMFY
jgi:hypothetical protein